jgi:glycosyltransferase involved in cell wall biosynthesis
LNNMKKALIVSYMFPPISGGGTLRPLKFVKYLPKYGIQPIVFCPESAAWKAYDYKNLELPFLRDVPTYRCGIRRLQRYYHLKYTKGLRRHPLFYLLALKYVCFLDFFSAWYFECRDKALEIAQKEKVDCIFTTSPPHSIHLFGPYLKKRLNIPWVMDIRDAMTDDPNRKHSPGMRLQSALETYYEKRFYGSADAIVSVSNPIIESIRTRHAKLHLDSKTHTIQNGFDDEDFTISKEKKNKGNLFTVTYTGSFMGKQTPEFFLKAVRLLIEKSEVDASDILVRFVGHFDKSTLSLINRFSSLLSIEVIEFQPYAEALRYQLSSHLLLLIVNIEEHEGGAQTMTGKFFEYIGAARPIFAMVPNGPLREIILKGRFGVVASPKNISEIAEKFHHIFLEWKSRGTLKYEPDLDLRNSFSRKQLTGRLAAIIEKITGGTLT